MKPPKVQLLTKKISSGRPTIVAKVTDALAGVDPFSLRLFFGPPNRVEEVGAATYDDTTGIATFSIPREALALEPGTQFMRIVAADYQEAKNIDTEGDSPRPNTQIAGVRLQAVARPTVSWVTPAAGRCLAAKQKLVVAANDNVRISSVGFFDGKRQIGRVRKDVSGLYQLTWSTKGKKKGRHVLTATASDIRGREASASHTVKICK